MVIHEQFEDGFLTARRVLKSWRETPELMHLILTDQAMFELPEKLVNIIVHFDLPQSKKPFAIR
jgi:hypothetical protein